MAEVLMKPQEVARTLQVSRSTAYALIASGQIPSLRIGKCVRVSRESLREWLRAQEEARAHEHL